MRLRYFSRFLFLTVLILLSSCKVKEEYPLYAEHEYSEVSAMTIPIENCFEMAENEYFIYIYLSRCGHCLKIKNMMIEFALSAKIPTYFVVFDEKIPIVNDVSMTIGASSVNEILILGIPTLIDITNKEITFNIAGVKAITDIIEPYFFV